MKAPRLTLGLPVFNGERYLRECLESFLSQTFDDFEVLISDNASRDATAEICGEYLKRDKRVKYQRLPSNIGAAPNFNWVAERARTDYFKWVAHDDLAEPDFLKRCVERLDDDPDIVLCYPRAHDIDENGKVLGINTTSLDLMQDDPASRFRDFLRSRGCFPVFGVLRRSVLDQTPRIASFPNSDRVLLGELALRGKICEVPEVLGYHRKHPWSSTRKHPGKRDFAVWFDPKNRFRLVAPKLQTYRGLVRAIRKAVPDGRERRACYRSLSDYLRFDSRLAERLTRSDKPDAKRSESDS